MRRRGPAGERATGGARSALGLLTVLGGAAPPTPLALAWFGPVGLLVGSVVGAAWWAGTQVLPAAVAAGLAVIVDLALTGLLHVDGLADTADGLLPPLERSRRLAVMHQPEVGAFGVAAVVVVLGLRGATLAALGADGRPGTILLVAGLWGAARASMALVLATVPPARPDGLAAAFGPDASGPAPSGRAASGSVSSARPTSAAVPQPRSGAVGLVGLALAAVVLVGGWWWPGLVAGAGGLLAGAALVALARRRLGGCSGDVLGAMGLVVETTGLVVATVWA